MTSIKKITLNGRPLNRRYITHDEITSGGKLIFYMSDKPAKQSGAAPDSRPF